MASKTWNKRLLLNYTILSFLVVALPVSANDINSSDSLKRLIAFRDRVYSKNLGSKPDYYYSIVFSKKCMIAFNADTENKTRMKLPQVLKSNHISTERYAAAVFGYCDALIDKSVAEEAVWEDVSKNFLIPFVEFTIEAQEFKENNE